MVSLLYLGLVNSFDLTLNRSCNFGDIFRDFNFLSPSLLITRRALGTRFDSLKSEQLSNIFFMMVSDGQVDEKSKINC